VDEDTIEWHRELHDKIFVDFKEHVDKHREGKLKESELHRIFNADVMVGSEAKEVGLIDEVGIIEEVMDEKYPEIKVVDFAKKSPF